MPWLLEFSMTYQDEIGELFLASTFCCEDERERISGIVSAQRSEDSRRRYAARSPRCRRRRKERCPPSLSETNMTS